MLKVKKMNSILKTLLVSFVFSSVFAQEKPWETKTFQSDAQAVFHTIFESVHCLAKEEDFLTRLKELTRFTIPLADDKVQNLTNEFNKLKSDKVFESSEAANLVAYKEIKPIYTDYYIVVEVPEGLYCIKASVRHTKNGPKLYKIYTTRNRSEISDFIKKYGFGQMVRFMPYRFNI